MGIGENTAGGHGKHPLIEREDNVWERKRKANGNDFQDFSRGWCGAIKPLRKSKIMGGYCNNFKLMMVLENLKY